MLESRATLKTCLCSIPWLKISRGKCFHRTASNMVDFVSPVALACRAPAPGWPAAAMLNLFPRPPAAELLSEAPVEPPLCHRSPGLGASLLTRRRRDQRARARAVRRGPAEWVARIAASRLRWHDAPLCRTDSRLPGPESELEVVPRAAAGPTVSERLEALTAAVAARVESLERRTSEQLAAVERGLLADSKVGAEHTRLVESLARTEAAVESLAQKLSEEEQQRSDAEAAQGLLLDGLAALEMRVRFPELAAETRAWRPVLYRGPPPAPPNAHLRAVPLADIERSLAPPLGGTAARGLADPAVPDPTLVASAAPEAFVDAGRMSRHSAGGHPQPVGAASVRASLQSVALRASDGGAQLVDTRLSTASGAVLVEPRQFRVRHSEGLVQSVLQGCFDETTRASELSAEPGRGSRVSAPDMTGVDSLAAPPVPSAVPEASVDAGRMSRHSSGWHAQPEDAASVRASQQKTAAGEPVVRGGCAGSAGACDRMGNAYAADLDDVNCPDAVADSDLAEDRALVSTLTIAGMRKLIRM